MISIICTSCKTELTIDDAFAGGVCRCQYCGTIQTVPAKSKTTARTKPQPTPAPKTLYQNRPGQRPSIARGTGLDDLADAVASSGLSGSGMGNRRRGTKSEQAAISEKQAADRQRLMMIILIAAGAVIVLLVILLAVLLFHGSGSSGSASRTPPVNTFADVLSGRLHFPVGRASGSLAI